MALNIDGTGFTKASNTALMKLIAERVKTALYKRFSMKATVVGASGKYEWLGDVPGMVEWLGDRQIKALIQHAYTIINREWEQTMGFSINELRRTPEIVNERIPAMADAIVDHPTSLMFNLITDNGICFDGQPFYDNSHPYLDMNEVDQVFDNLLSGTGSTVAQIKADFIAMKAAFLGFKKRNGEPVFSSLGKITILHSPDLDGAMSELFGADIISQTTNIYKGQAEHIVDGNLSGDDWYGFLLDKAMKPFIFQTEKKVTSEWDKTQSFMKKHWFFGADGIYNMGYAFPSLSIKMDN